MKKLLISILLLVPLYLSAQIKILENVKWEPVIKSNWVNNDGLSYSNTVYGDTYYNSDYQDMEKSNSIEYKTVYQYFNLKPEYKRDWTFQMRITNLNAEQDFLYYSKDKPKKKQSAYNIYWGVTIGYKENGISRTTAIWIKRSHPDSHDYLGSGNRISYKVDNGSWKTSNGSRLYPSCDPSQAPAFVIDSKKYNHTNISWGELKLCELPVYIEELTYISVMVGSQAKVQIRKPTMVAYREQAYGSPNLINWGKYKEAKDDLYREDGMYFEVAAMDLAICYINLKEFENAIEMCDALIKFNGEYVAKAYFTRGVAREVLGDFAGALEDYRNVGNEIGNEYYNNLYSRLYR